MAKLIVGTMPIGNMEDMSIRMIRLIKESKFIIVEDEQFIRTKLQNFGIEIECPVFAIGNTDIGYYGHEAIQATKEKLNDGVDVLIISDEGCASLGEPTSVVISAIGKCGYDIETVPGPSVVSSSMVHISSQGHGLANNIAYITLSHHAKSLEAYIKFINNNPEIPTISVVNHQIVDSGLFDTIIDRTGDRDVMILTNMSIVGEEEVAFSTFEKIKQDRPYKPFTIVVMPKIDEQ